MSTTSSCGSAGREYKPLPRPKEQVTFTAKRRSVKAASSIPTLNKKQSSLTQMPFVGAPRTKEVLPISSDGDESEYEERPAKKRKPNTGSTGKGRKIKNIKKEDRAADQSTFTQCLGKMAAPRRSRFDRDGFQVWQDSDTEGDVGDDGRSGLNGRASAPLTMVEDEPENAIPEIAESSQSARTEEVQDQPAARKAESVTTNLRTPQKVRFVEIPSSQTPPSTGLSTQRPARHRRSISRSPLKERSINARSPTKKLASPDSQNMSMKMLERTRFANQQARRKAAEVESLVDKDLEQCAAEATDDFSLRTYPMPPPPARTLHRMTTVQDSQADELAESLATGVDYESPKLTRTGTIPDSQRNSSNETLTEDSQFQRPKRKLSRVATVQDSQFDDDEIAIDGDREQEQEAVIDLDDLHETMNDDNDDYGQHATYPDGTYDPAFSALDRDASRFTWTQTQQQVSVVNDDSETDDEDLDRGCAVKTLQRDGPSDKASQEIGAPLNPPSDAFTKHSEGIDLESPKDTTRPGDTTVHCESAYESGDQAVIFESTQVPSSPSQLATTVMLKSSTTNTEDARVSSSPPPLQASQVSTFVPTQASIALGPTSPQKPIKDEPFSLPPTPRHHSQNQARNHLTSPQKPNSLWQPESRSSSPLPLPPWTSPEKHRASDLYRGTDGGVGLSSEPQMDSLADFSLPPPPPLSSSRRQTPASSSL